MVTGKHASYMTTEWMHFKAMQFILKYNKWHMHV